MKKKTEDRIDLTVVVDRSGSMNNKVEDTIGGFNSMVEDQKKVEAAELGIWVPGVEEPPIP